jgi:hypothetical protein
VSGGFALRPLAVGEGPLVQRDRLRQSPLRIVGSGEVASEIQGAGVGFALQPLEVGGGPLHVLAIDVRVVITAPLARRAATGP